MGGAQAVRNIPVAFLIFDYTRYMVREQYKLITVPYTMVYGIWKKNIIFYPEYGPSNVIVAALSPLFVARDVRYLPADA